VFFRHADASANGQKDKLNASTLASGMEQIYRASSPLS
jgi:hypothetical protein